MVLVNNDNIPKAFTIAYNGLANAIICQVGITPLRDLRQIKDSEIINLNALWDTGATNCVVTKETAKRLGLRSVGKTVAQHAGGASETNIYLVQLFLPNKFTLSVRVTECDNSSEFGLIIGMDVISKGDFSITNVNGQTAVSFRMPSLERIDYVQGDKANRVPIHATSQKHQQRNEPCNCGSGKKYKHCCGKGK